jgi:phosphatidylglycerophosphate synthase
MENRQIIALVLFILIIFQFVILVIIGRRMGNLNIPYNEYEKRERITENYKSKLKLLIVTIILSFMSISLIDNFENNIQIFIVVSFIAFPLLYYYFIKKI